MYNTASGSGATALVAGTGQQRCAQGRQGSWSLDSVPERLRWREGRDSISAAGTRKAPSEMLGMINNLTAIAEHPALTNSDFLAIDNTLGEIFELICA